MSAESYRILLIETYKNAISHKSPAWIDKLIVAGNAFTPKLKDFEIVIPPIESVPLKLKNLFLKPISKRKLYVTKYSQTEILIEN